MHRPRASSTLLTLSLLLVACSRSPDDPFDDAGDDLSGDEGIGDDNGTADDTGNTSGGDTGGSDSDDSSATETGDDGNSDTDTGAGDTDTSGSTGDSDTDSDNGTDSGTDTTDGDTGTDTTGTTDTDTEPEPCQVTGTTVEPTPPNVMLVLDKSGSMSAETWDHDSDGGTAEIKRWESLHGAVTLMVNTYESDVKFGAKLFPRLSACGTSNSCGCPVDSGVEADCALDNAAGILAAIPGADVDVQGGTPSASGLQNASEYLQSLAGTDPSVMILIADGEISCNEDFDDALSIVTDAAASGIPTYVIGIDAQDDPMDDNDAHDQLTILAEAGGKPNPGAPPSFYQTQNQADLETAMNDIISDALSCRVAIDPEPQAEDLFQVWIGDEQVPRATDCATEDGWVWTQDFSEIEFCGTACDDLKVAGEMEGRYFCRPG